MADGGDFEIQIDPKGSFKRSYLDQHELHAQSLYRFAKLNDITALCMCVDGGVDMQIAHMSKHDNYVLKRNPNSGHRHHPDCWSYGESQQALQTTNYIEALIVKDDGSTDIKVDVSIKFAETGVTPKAGSPTPRSQRTLRKATSLKGLFEFLWKETGLMQWEPDDKRLKYKDIREVIRNNLADNKSCNNQLLEEILFIPYYDKWGPYKEMLTQKTQFTNEAGARLRIIVLGLVNTYEDTKYGKLLKLYTIDKSVLFFINKESTINRLTKALPCNNGNYKFDQAQDGFYWFIGTAFPQLKQDESGFITIIDEGVVIPVSNEHVPLGNSSNN